MTEKYKQLQSQLKEIKKELAKEAARVFSEQSKELFEKHESLRSFGWRQYTMYFNDGSPCKFDVHGDYPIINQLDNDDEFNLICPVCGREEYVGWDARKNDKPVNKVCPLDQKKMEWKVGDRQQFEVMRKAVSSFLRSIAKKQFKKMFGDHVKVMVNRDGIEIEEYTDHD